MTPELRSVGATLERPRLETLLDEAFGRRLTTVVADAGYGKTTLLAQWPPDGECAWYTVSPPTLGWDRSRRGSRMLCTRSPTRFAPHPG